VAQRSHIAPLVYLKGEDMDFFMPKISNKVNKINTNSTTTVNEIDFSGYFALQKIPRKAGDRWRIYFINKKSDVDEEI